jgi:hypothetical protein
MPTIVENKIPGLRSGIVDKAFLIETAGRGGALREISTVHRRQAK